VNQYRTQIIFSVSLVAIASLIWYFIGNRKSPNLAPPPTPMQAIETSTTTTTQVKPDPIASLAQLRPEVSYRRSGQLIWSEASSQQSLFQYDAIHTHQDADAKIVFTTGSELEIQQNTFIIIDPKSIKQNKEVDRAVMRSGQVHGKTKGQLWIMTSAAVIKLRGGKKNKEAAAIIKVTEGQKMQIQMQEGEASLLVPTSKQSLMNASEQAPQIKEISLKSHQTISIAAPQLAESFGTDQENINWLEGSKVIQEAPQKIEESVVQPPYLTIDQPAARSETAQPEIEIVGKTNVPGAQLIISGKSYAVDSLGRFQARISVKTGLNLFVIQVIGSDGKSLFQKIIVKGTGSR